jgi:hypothetical protein
MMHRLPNPIGLCCRGRRTLAPRPHWVTLDALLRDDFPHR